MSQLELLCQYALFFSKIRYKLYILPAAGKQLKQVILVQMPARIIPFIAYLLTC